MKKLFKIMLTAILLIFSSVLLNVSASALSFYSALQYQTESTVTLWSKKDYEGESKQLGIGEYADIDFSVKSITVPQEYAVFAYSEKNFEGTEYYFNDSVDKLLKLSLTDGLFYVEDIRSIKIALIESESVDITDLDDEKKNNIR